MKHQLAQNLSTHAASLQPPSQSYAAAASGNVHPTSVPSSSQNIHPPQLSSFGPVPSHSGSGSSTNPIQFLTDHKISFEHHGTKYTLQDKDFIKSGAELQSPTTEEDALSFYSTLQQQALIHNIFITPINKVTKWDQSPNSIPPMCCLQHNNTNYSQVYQRMATALFTKINQVKFDKIKIFKTLLDHEKATQDGFRVLYSLYLSVIQTSPTM